jgi:hypothetical protein
MKQNQYEYLINKISRELNISGSEKNFAFEVFINRISESLKFDETIKIPRLGFFQLKKGNATDSNSDTLVFVPFNKLTETEDFAFINIPVKKKENEFNKAIEDLFSLSINKPIISIDISKKESSNYSTSLFKLQKYLEENINELIKKSDFLEGLNLWEDFVVNNEMDFVEEKTVENELEEKDEISFLPKLEVNFDDSYVEFDNREETPAGDKINNDITNNFELDNIDNFLNENLFNEGEQAVKDKNEEFFDVNSDKSAVDLLNNEINLSDEEELAVIDDLSFSDEPTFVDKQEKQEIFDKENNTDDLLNNAVPNEIKTEKKVTDSTNINNLANDTDWTKELEDELFSDEKDDEQIELIDLNDTIIDNFEDNTNITNEDDIKEITDDENTSDEADKIEDIGEISNISINDIDEIEDTTKEENNTNIDELFDSLTEDIKESTAKPKKKINFKKILIFTAIGIIILALLGTAYFMFFNKSKNDKKEELINEKKTKTENVVSHESKSNLITTENTDKKADSIINKGNLEVPKAENTKTEVKTEQKEDNKISTTKETINKKESITNDKKLKEEPVAPITGELYKEGVDDKQISEKIFYDGKKYNVQTSSWNSRLKAETEAKRLRAKGIKAYVVKAYLKKLGSTWYRIKIFDFNTKAEAEEFIKKNNL